MTASIRVLVVDDQRLMRDGLRTLLELEDDLVVVGEASSGEAAVSAFAELQPDVVLMDVRMPGVDGVEATRRIRTNWPDARIIILTTFDDDEYVFEGLRAGAQGYLLKAIAGAELARAIRTVMAGGALIDPAVTRKVVAEFARLAPPARAPDAGLAEPLAEREIDILRLVAQGLSNREIAQRLFLAEGTVKNYVTAILQKIGVRDRTQAALRGRELGLL
ncbi:MAG TPA: DNA-binding response regulator [Chloroflexi bacterium]|nr:DNA-binding response regulator [Chloroflexota bacterium]HHW87626.1 response regulator transcription factor [Chloroflexota bacterium]